jgi:hypothetical protein
MPRFLALTVLTLALIGAAAASTSKAAAPTPATPSAAPDPLPRNITICGTVIGGAWKLPTRRGNTWTVEAKETPCGLARTWAARLTHQQTLTSKGPPGWTCHPTGHAVIPASSGGTCTKGTAFFLWGIPPLHP